MNWLKKVAQPIPQVNSIGNQLMSIVDGILMNDGTDLTFAKQQLQQAQAQGVNMDAVCKRINESAAGVNPAQPDSAAYGKMKGLADAVGCPWNPVNPPMAQQPDNNMMDPSMMPMMGQQEKPMDIPSTEIE